MVIELRFTFFKFHINMENLEVVFIFCFSLLLFIEESGCNLNLQIHEYMTENEFKVVFPTFDSYESIPKYELVRLSLEKADQHSLDHFTSLSFSGFREKRNVKLQQYRPSIIGVHTPVWYTKYDSIDEHVIIEEFTSFNIDDAVTFYKTTEESILGCMSRNGAVQITGHIGNTTIRSLTSRVSSEIYRRKRHILREEFSFENENLTDKHILTDYHIIYNTPQTLNNDMFQSTVRSINNFFKEFKQQNDTIKFKRHKRDNPNDDNSINPEILLITDYNVSFNQHNNSTYHEFIIYLIAFWNNVALYFKTLTNPIINLRIVGIVISSTQKTLPFLSDNLSPSGFIYGDHAISDKKHWLRNHQDIFPITSYDFAITMTTTELCPKNDATNDCEYPLSVGIAIFQGSCALSTFKINMLAIIFDNSHFGGVTTTVHEIGHLMGVPHNGEISVQTRACNLSDVQPNYVMSPVVHEDNNMIWSNCSREIMSAPWTNPERKCLKMNSTFDTGDTVNELILPGHLVSLDDQCKNHGYTNACFPTNEICKYLQCRNESQEYIVGRCYVTKSPLSGSKCGVNHHCISGECVPCTLSDVFEDN